MGVEVRLESVEEERPVRLLARYLSDYLFASADRWIELTGGDPLDTLLVRAVFGSNLAHLPYHDARSWQGLLTAAEPGRPVAISAVAQSLGLPFETVRLRVKALCGAGALERTPQGLDALGLRHHAPFGALVIGEAEALCQLVGAIAREAYDPEGQMTVGAEALGNLPADVAARLALDFGLRCTEQFVTLHGGLQQGIITTALVAANVRHILQDVALSRRFAVHRDPPPDSLRMPVTIRALQRELNMPFETVRRHIHALGKRGVAEQHGDGWIVPARHLTEAKFERLNARNSQALMRMVETAIRLWTPDCAAR